ncbi:damage-specific DNA binding protein 1, putative [Theileria annulata]|uniref:DNA damage-binding protein 1 n=1 Tax=Theileria annulata TaxID=5874 RepID=Q4UGI4_THEAN|nr:damage-specific DNA binding protein 1, putative [Theileria annulata]CAI73805.1 damage-specific DNA binding protein 1, putative [Theileria annulata]|eukprot:XP_954482.1 damage-specific DNA binding protein 1, putative [Theileria annulata]
MYGYFVTTAPSGATLKAIRCRLVKDSLKEYLVCLKRHSIEVYSLENNQNRTVNKDGNHFNPPVLTSVLNANSTFVNFIDYRPPTETQTHLLVLTRNFTLFLLTYHENLSKFTSKAVSSLQELHGRPNYENIIFKVDSGYNLLIFYGYHRVLKCIVLDPNNYFNFSDLVTIRTNDAIFVDFEFISSEYTEKLDTSRASSTTKRKNTLTNTPSRSFSGSSSSSISNDIQFKSPTRNSTFYFLESSLIILGEDNVYGSNKTPVRWVYGMKLMFEIEILNGCKRFNSYTHTPLFGDPIKLSVPYSKLIPLNLVNKTNRYDSVMLLGPGSTGFISFKSPRHVKQFKINNAITEVTCCCAYRENKFIFGDDNGGLYLLRLSISALRKTVNTVKRRAVYSPGMSSSSGSQNNSTVSSQQSNKSLSGEQEFMVSEVMAVKLGNFPVPSSLIKLDEEHIFYTSKMGDSSILSINSILNSSNRYEQNSEQSDRNSTEWAQTNLGPITDFAYREETSSGETTILACCGMGNSGSFCEIYLGLSSEIIHESDVPGVLNLFSVPMKSLYNSTSSLLCISFFRFTKFYNFSLSSVEPSEPPDLINLEVPEPAQSRRVNVGRVNKRQKAREALINALENNTRSNQTVTKVINNSHNPPNNSNRTGKITKFENNVFLCNEKTILLSHLRNGNILQVTPRNIVFVNDSFKTVKRTKISQIVRLADDKLAVSSVVCNPYIILLLSNNCIVALEFDLKLVSSRNLEFNVSAMGCITKNDLLNSDLGIFAGAGGLLAVSSWDSNNVILFLTVKDLKVVCSHKISLDYDIFAVSIKFAKINTNVYLLLSLSNGVLYIYQLTKIDRTIKFTLVNKSKLSLWSFKLLELKVNNDEDEDTCNLSKVHLITTGPKSYVIHPKNGKINYTKINTDNLHTMTTIANLKSVENTEKQEMLVIYNNHKSVVVGKLNLLNNFNVQKILKGSNFNKVVYHSKTKLAVISTIPQYIINPSNLTTNTPINSQNTDVLESGYTSATNTQSQLSPCASQQSNNSTDFNSQLSLPDSLLICMNDDAVLSGTDTTNVPSEILLVDIDTKEVVYRLSMPQDHLISSMHKYTHAELGKDYIVFGTSKVSEANDVPTEGFLYFLEVYKESESCTVIVNRNTEPFKGGVVEITSLNKYLVIAVNSTVMVIALPGPNDNSNSNDNTSTSVAVKDSDCNVKKNILELVDINDSSTLIPKIDENTPFLDVVASYDSNTFVVSLDTKDDVIFVGDLMTSVKMLKFRDNSLHETCRDFNTLWTTSLVAVDNSSCLVSDDSGNFMLLKKVKHPVTDQQSIKFDKIGLFHHGEVVNKILKRTEMPIHHEADTTITRNNPREFMVSSRVICESETNSPSETSSLNEHNNLFKGFFTCATTSGSLFQVCFFEDLKMFLKLSLLEHTMQLVQKDLGNIPSRNQRNFEDLHSNIPTRGFVDGDLVESFLKLPDSLKKWVFDTMLINSKQLGIKLNSLESLLYEVDRIKHLRLE